MLAAALPSDLSASHDLLHALLAVSLPGIILFRPVYAAHDPATVSDLAYVHLNPAAQQMLRLPAQPPDTFLTLYPSARETGIFAFYRDTFLSGEPGEYAVNYSFDGLDNFFQLTARRSGELLVVGFTDTSTQDRSAVEQALRESQAREQAARAEAERQRQRFYEVLMQLPAQVATYHGPEHVYQFVNARYRQFVAQHELLGRTVREAGQGAVPDEVFAMLDHVYATGEPVQLREVAVVLDRYQAGPAAPLFIDAFYVPLRDAAGGIYGVLDFSYDVTELVLARRQVEQLNQELETRVQQRTHEVERQRGELRRLFEQVPLAIVVLRGPTFIIEQANEYAAAIWGHPVAEVLGRPHFEALPEAAGQGYEELLTGVRQSGQPLVLHEVVVQLARAHTGRPDTGYYNIVFKPLRDEQQQVDSVAVIWTEVTEQVLARQQVEQLNRELAQAQAETEAQRLRLHQLIAEAPALIASLRGPAHVVELANEGFRAIFGGRELVGKTYREAIPEFESQPFFDRLDRVYRTGETYYGIEEPVVLDRTNSGQLEHTFITYTYQATRDAQGRIDGILVFCYEVTQQVLARQEREAQRQRLARFFQQAPAAISVLNGPDLVYELVNDAYQGLFPGRQLLGRPLLAALPEAADLTVYHLIRRVYETGETFTASNVPTPLRNEAGEQEDYYFDLVIQARYDEQGRVDGVLNFGLDVTPQVRARQQVQDLNEELAAINEELTATNEELHESNTQLTRTNVDLDTFVYTASHDLKAPITNIEGILLALRAQLPAAVQQEEEVAQLLEMLQGTVERFQLTITQLTDITKLQLAHAGPAEPVQLAGVVESVRLDLAPLIEAAAAALTVEVSLELVVSFSPANLRSIVYNLLSNAVKYRSAERPAQVRVRAEHTPAAVVLTVQDNGLGMSQVQQRQLFGLFQRLHTHVEGTGVGLYIVKRLVENGGGTIAVQSQPDTGTTFTVTFPHPGT